MKVEGKKVKTVARALSGGGSGAAVLAVDKAASIIRDVKVPLETDVEQGGYDIPFWSDGEDSDSGSENGDIDVDVPPMSPRSAANTGFHSAIDVHKFVDHNQKDLFEVENYLKPWQQMCPEESLVQPTSDTDKAKANAELANLRKGYGLPLRALTVQIDIGGETNQD